ncbi:MAG: xanthine dehydrogenase family protein molybdopterin-binding subunit [Burkholderiaceae bacterium]
MKKVIDHPRARYGVGQAVRRIEDQRLLTGQACFTDDTPADGHLHLMFVRSPHAHARIRSIETSAALGLPGVVAVITAADLSAAGIDAMPALAEIFHDAEGRAPGGGRRPVLAADTVRFVGEAVAAVVAQTAPLALDALEAVLIDYEPLASITDLARASEPSAPAVDPECAGNLSAMRRLGDAAAVDAAFASAAHVAEVRAVNQRLAPVSLEPRAVIAWRDPDNQRLTVRLSNQMPTGIRNTLAAMLGLETDSVRVLVGDVGGGFGMKTGIYPEDVVVAHAAWTLGRPVRWMPGRQEDFLSAVHGRDMIAHASLALDADGRMLALRLRTDANLGAYPSAIGLAQPFTYVPGICTNVYRIGCVDLDQRALLTHTAPIGAYRGAGSPESIFIIERLVDEAARVCGLDPVSLRRRNLIPPALMPYENPLGQCYDCGQFERMLDQALEHARWHEFEQRAAESDARGRLRGRAVVTFLKACGANQFEEEVEIRVAPEGIIEVVSATMPMGQGIATSYAQLLVQAFDIPIERIRVIQGDTDRANGFGSGGSRSLLVGGSVIDIVARRTLDVARGLAADALEVGEHDLEYQAGRFEIVGTDRGIDLFTLAGQQSEGEIRLADTDRVDGQTWPNAAHVCEVEIDPATGQVQVQTYVGVYDVGTVVSPQIVAGQLEGGIVQSIGQVLLEEVVYDDDTGQMLTASLMDYALPQFGVIDGFTTLLDQSVPTARNPLGAKGVGEIGTTGALPAVFNAVIDALARAGVPEARLADLQMPLTAPKIWAAIGDSAQSASVA